MCGNNGRSLLQIVVHVLLSAIISGCDQESKEPTTENVRTESNDDVRTFSVPQMEFRRDHLNKAVEAYVSGKLKDDGGVAKLPDSYANATSDGLMYVTKRPSGEMFLFVAWRGKGSNLRGYLYRLSDQHGSQSQEAMADRIEVLGPTIWSPGYGRIDIGVEKSLGLGWYEVKRDED